MNLCASHSCGALEQLALSLSMLILSLSCNPTANPTRISPTATTKNSHTHLVVNQGLVFGMAVLLINDDHEQQLLM